MGKNFKIMDDFLGKGQLISLQEFFEDNVSWEFGSQSDRWKLPFGHWNCDFLNTDPRNQSSCEEQLLCNTKLHIIAELWQKIKNEVFMGDELVRCYANAHTYGVEGYPHVDHRLPGNHTTVVYVNPVWTHEWAGETVLINEMGDVIHASLPKPGRILAFDGRITHVARSVSRRCPALRATLVYKSKTMNTKKFHIPEKYLEFLRKNGAHLLPHSEDYSLLDHLIGTYQTLKEYRASEYLCLAGLFHSVYGTEIFKEITIEMSQRDKIRELIGLEAEELVFSFCTLDRPFLFESSLINNNFSWKNNLKISFDKEQACKDLLSLECANILEQKGFEKYPALAGYAMQIGMINAQGI